MPESPSASSDAALDAEALALWSLRRIAAPGGGCRRPACSLGWCAAPLAGELIAAYARCPARPALSPPGCATRTRDEHALLRAVRAAQADPDCPLEPRLAPLAPVLAPLAAALAASGHWLDG